MLFNVHILFIMLTMSIQSDFKCAFCVSVIYFLIIYVCVCSVILNLLLIKYSGAYTDDTTETLCPSQCL